tara:strand:+ start:137 stop:1243 length:1107 start_codon:yes stop_codon:yes gene_type:complete
MKIKSLFLLFFLFSLPIQSQESSIELIAESDKSLLSQVVDLDISKTGDHVQLYTIDAFITSVLVAQLKGRKLKFNNRLGREGLGPGEFIEITNIEKLSNEILLVYDRNLGRISIFNVENGKVVKTIKLDTKEKLDFPMKISLSEKNKLFYSRSERFFSDKYSPDDKRNINIQSFNEHGELVKDSILIKPSDNAYVFQKNGNMSVNPSPIWGKKSLIEFKKDKIFYCWTGKPTIEMYNLEGKLVKTLSFDLPHLKFSDSDKMSALNFESMMIDIKKSEIKKSLYEVLPENWPWIHDFLIDDRGRIWIALPNHFNSTKRNWQVYNSEGSFEKEHEFPLNFTIHQIEDDIVVGELFDFDKFVSTVRVYKVF